MIKNNYDNSYYTKLRNTRDKAVGDYLKERQELSGLTMMFMGRKRLRIYELERENELLKVKLSATEDMVDMAIHQCQIEQNKFENIKKDIMKKLEQHLSTFDAQYDIPKIESKKAIRLDLYSKDNMFSDVQSEVVKITIPTFDIAYLRDLIYDEADLVEVVNE